MVIEQAARDLMASLRIKVEQETAEAGAPAANAPAAAKKTRRGTGKAEVAVESEVVQATERRHWTNTEKGSGAPSPSLLHCRPTASRGVKLYEIRAHRRETGRGAKGADAACRCEPRRPGDRMPA